MFGGSQSKPTSSLFGQSTAKPAFGGGGGTFASSSTGMGQSTGFFSKPAQSSFGKYSFNKKTKSSEIICRVNINKIILGGGLFGPKTTTEQPQSQIVQAQEQSALLSLYEDPYGVRDMKSTYSAASIDTERQIILNKIVDQIKFYNGDKQSRYNEDTYEDKDIIGTPNPFSSSPISLKLHRRDEEFNGSFKKKENVFNQKDTDTNVFIEGETKYRMLEYQKAKQNEDFSFNRLNPNTVQEQQELLSSTWKYIREKNKASQEQVQRSANERLYFKDITMSGLASSKQDDECEVYELTGPNVIKVLISIFIDDGEEKLVLSVNKSRKVKDLIDLVINKLKSKYQFISDPSTLIQIIHKSTILSLDLILEEFEVKSGSRFDILVQEKQTTPVSQPGVESTDELMIFNTESSNMLAPLEKLPIMKRKDYTLYPSLVEIARMTELQLSSIENLSIENEYGQILWEGETDVRGINFDVLVNLDLYSATVYPEEIERQNLKPEVGQGLNKPATITLFKIFPSMNANEAARRKFAENLKKKTSNIPDAEFISYDEYHGVLSFKVAHFTTYDFSNIYHDLLSLKRHSSEKGKLLQSIALQEEVSLNRKSSNKLQKSNYLDSWKTTFRFNQEEILNKVSFRDFRPKFEGNSIEEFILSKSLGVIYEFNSKNLV